jgi:hypothetical protein
VDWINTLSQSIYHLLAEPYNSTYFLLAETYNFCQNGLKYTFKLRFFLCRGFICRHFSMVILIVWLTDIVTMCENRSLFHKPSKNMAEEKSDAFRLFSVYCNNID